MALLFKARLRGSTQLYVIFNEEQAHGDQVQRGETGQTVGASP
jgi:hypothetical protein